MIVLSTGSLYSYGLNRAFELAAQAGFQGVEVLIDGRWDTRQAHYLKALQEAHGLPIVSLHSPFVGGIQGWEPDQLNRLKRTVALAQEVGARHVVAHLPFRFAFVWINASWFREKPIAFPLPGNRDGAYRRLLTNGLAAFGDAAGVTVVVENLPCRKLGRFTYDGYQMNTIAEWGSLPHLNFDTTHLATWGHDILAVYEQVKTRIRHVHLSNYKDGKEHRLLWDGHLPLAELLQRLRRDSFDGILCVELDPDPLEAGSEAKVKENLRRSYQFCHEHYHEHYGGSL